MASFIKSLREFEAVAHRKSLLRCLVDYKGRGSLLLSTAFSLSHSPDSDKKALLAATSVETQPEPLPFSFSGLNVFLFIYLFIYLYYTQSVLEIHGRAFQNVRMGGPIAAQWVKNQRYWWGWGSIPALAQRVKNLVSLWLWSRLAAVAPV